VSPIIPVWGVTNQPGLYHIDSWASRFADDAAFYFANTPPIVGRSAILAWGKAMPQMETFTFADVAVAGEGNLAYGTSRVFSKLQGAPADTAKQLVVFRRSASGRWLVQAGSVSSDLPLPQAAPAAHK